MAYTPIGWQTGDTITAEKMNKMDNGWGFEPTQLFSESVTTADQGGMNQGTLAYSQTIDADTITVAFNGADYTCSRIDAFGEHFYGGFTKQGLDFSEFPFTIEIGEEHNFIYTQTAGTYTVAVSAENTEVSDNFSVAVNQCVDTSTMPMLCISGETTESEILTALSARRMLYFYVMGDLFIITRYTSSANSFSTIPTSSLLIAEISNGVFNADYKN